MVNPDYMKIAEAYGIPSLTVTDRADLADAINTMLTTDGPFLLEAAIMQGENVMPMTPPGGAVNVMMMNASDC
jgi:acetolactate synthase-1/2/3 large subunit